MNNRNYFYNKAITDMYVQSLYIGNELIGEFNVVYFKIANWFKLVVDEGEVTIRKIDEVILLPLDEIDDEFKYPVQDYSNDTRFKKIIGCKINNIELLKYNDGDDYFAIKFNFNNGDYLYYYENLKEEKSILTTDSIVVPDNIDYIEYDFIDNDQ